KLFNEGWNAGHVANYLAGDGLYHPPQSLLTNNYPPLSFLLTAALTHLVPDPLFAGRLASSIAFLGIIGLIALILHRMHRDWRATLMGALIFAGYIANNASDYVGADDPQFLGLVLSLAGLLVALAGSGGRA